MADSINIVTYFSVVVPNKPGEGAKVLVGLKDAGIQLTGFWAYPIKGKKKQLDLVPTDAKAFGKAAKKLGLNVAPKQSCLCWIGEDHPGALAGAAVKLGDAGIPVHAAQAISTGEGKFGCLVQVAAEHLKKAKKVLS